MSLDRLVVAFDRSLADWQSVQGVQLRSQEELESFICRTASAKAPVFDLISPEGTTLQLGLGSPFSCSQFLEAQNASKGAPTTFIARTEVTTAPESVDFVIADTPSPMPPQYCLKIDETLRIASFFFETGQRDPAISWEFVC